MKTIKEKRTNEIVIKNSRFITLLIKINSEEEIKDILQKTKITYPDATHYCYAYVTENINKSSDDGEPAGTAGIPMLNVLLKNNLTNILAITVRYFGGIKLGAGGLVRAYTKSLTETIKNSKIVELEKGLEVKIIINYDMQKNLDYLLKDYEIISKSYQEQITYIVKIPMTFLDKLNSYSIEKVKETYIEKDV